VREQFMAESVELDRVAPTRRPDGRAAGHQRWRELAFVHWSFAADAVRALVPRSLELDLWAGRAWVGLVPFRMRDIRPRWLPRALGLDFLETNLRTYVHAGGKPGVYFFSLEASSWLAVKAARWSWSLPYFHAAMTVERGGAGVRYRSRRRRGDARLAMDYDVGDELGPSAVGTLQHFLLERYHLFAEREGRLRRGQVHHQPYPVRSASIVSLDEGLLAAAGLPGDGRLETVHYSDGVDVEVFGPYHDA
jgi:uncharacterized protein YqjF (DUF2071 family)